MPYRNTQDSMLLTSGGMWSLIVIAIFGCCAAVVSLSRKPARKGTGIGRTRSREPLRVTYRRGSPLFRRDQIGLEPIHAGERPIDTASA